MRSFWFHGWATDSRVFGPPCAALPDRFRRDIIAPDLSAVLDGVDPHAWGESLAAWVRGKIPAGKSVLLVGWSMGAMLALEAAASLKEAVSGVIVISGCARFVRDPDNPDGQPERVLRLMQRRLKVYPGRVIEEFFDSMHALRGEDASGGSTRRDRLPICREQDPAWLERGLEYLLTADCRHLTPGIDAPSLVLHGELDSVISVRLGEILAGRLPEGKFVTLPWGNHVPFAGRPESVFPHIVSFIDGLSDPGGTA